VALHAARHTSHSTHPCRSLKVRAKQLEVVIQDRLDEFTELDQALVGSIQSTRSPAKHRPNHVLGSTCDRFASSSASGVPSGITLTGPRSASLVSSARWRGWGWGCIRRWSATCCPFRMNGCFSSSLADGRFTGSFVSVCITTTKPSASRPTPGASKTQLCGCGGVPAG